MFVDLEHQWRCPTSEAMHALAKQLDLPPTPLAYEWHYAVADPARIEDFVVAYENLSLSDDERFTLMEVILNSVIDAADTTILEGHVWENILILIENNIALHIYSVWYYSSAEQENIADAWCIAPGMRKILLQHQDKFAQPR
ncbi:MAG: hypothetical protein HY254_07840 [Burkholderiales bacterium]|nr:hypothetical protein [Burkholderiales bacterium]